MTAITRTFSVQYGSFVISQSTSPTGCSLDGLRMERAYRKAIWRFGVIVYGSDPANLESRCTALEAAIRTPRQDLTITMGSGSRSYSEASKTGYDQSGQLATVTNSPYNSPVAREYSVSIEVTTPAILASEAGLESYSYTLTTTAIGQRIVEIVGQFTTDGTNLARATYSAAIETLVSSIFTEISLDVTTFERLADDQGLEQRDFEMSFKRTYRELVFKDSLADFNHVAIKDARITANVSTIYGRMAIPDQILPNEIQVEYEALIDKAQSTDLPGIFNSVVKPLLQSLAQEYAASQGGGDPSILEIKMAPTPTGQVLRAQMIFVAFGPQRLIALEIKIAELVLSGVIKVPPYSTDPFARIRLPGVGSARQAVTTIATVQGTPADAYAAALNIQVAPTSAPGPTPGLGVPEYRALTREEASRLGSSGGGWTLERQSKDFDGPFYAGLPSLPVTTCFLVREYDYDTDPTDTPGQLGQGGGGRIIVSSVYDGT